MLNHQNLNIDFLVRLRRIDRAGYTVREVLSIYAIMSRPGISGKDLAEIVGSPFRSGIARMLGRLIERGMIEDRRKIVRKALPAQLYVTSKGEDFWNLIKMPDGE